MKFKLLFIYFFQTNPSNFLRNGFLHQRLHFHHYIPPLFVKSSFFFRYSDIFKVNLSANILDNEYRSSILKEIKECAFFLLQTLQLRGSEVSAKPSAHCSQCVSLPLMFYNANRRRT